MAFCEKCASVDKSLRSGLRLLRDTEVISRGYVLHTSPHSDSLKLIKIFWSLFRNSTYLSDNFFSNEPEYVYMIDCKNKVDLTSLSDQLQTCLEKSNVGLETDQVLSRFYIGKS